LNILWVTPLLASIISAGLLIGVILLKQHRGPVANALILAIGATAWIQISNALGILDQHRIAVWKEISVFGEIIFPIALYRIGLTFTQVDGHSTPCRTNGIYQILFVITCLCTGGLGLLLILSFFHIDGNDFPMYSKVFRNFVSFFILGSLVMALAQLEQVLRASRDPLRYKIKFVIIGLGGLASFSILQASQIEVFSPWNAEYAFAEGMITLLSIGLVAYGLGRWHLNEVTSSVYISSQALLTSFTFLIVGAYFILVGGMGELIRQTDWPMGKAS